MIPQSVHKMLRFAIFIVLLSASVLTAEKHNFDHLQEVFLQLQLKSQLAKFQNTNAKSEKTVLPEAGLPIVSNS